MTKVFISYARADAAYAERLFKELSAVDSLEPWMDRECLLPGVAWRPAIRKAIREANYFLALISARSVAGRGIRNTELAQALEILQEFPPEQIFLIPLRLEECEMPRDELTELNWVDLFPDWNHGMNRLLLVLAPQAKASASNSSDSKMKKPDGRYHYRVGLVDLDLGLPNIRILTESLNAFQNFFLFTYPQMSSVENAVGKIGGWLMSLKVYEIASSFFAERTNLTLDLVVCLTRYPLAFKEDGEIIYNYFAGESDEDERFLFVSTDKLFSFCQQAGRSFEEGLVHTVVGQLANYFTKIGYHEETRGCVMDHCKLRADQIYGLKSRTFCDECNRSLPEGELRTALEALLAWSY